jgi:Ala-tRNA(Pro) deacylase
MSAHDSSPTPAPTTTRVEAIVAFLEGEAIEYEVMEHESTMSAAAEARITYRPPDQVAKTVVLHDGGGYMIAAIPASERLDLRKLREVLGARHRLRLAGEDEIAMEFPTLEVGAVPPFGPMAPALEVIDQQLLRHERILFPAGDHRHSVLVDPREIVRITAAKTADICQD